VVINPSVSFGRPSIAGTGIHVQSIYERFARATRSRILRAPSVWRPVPSKKRSVAKPREETVFFIDRSLGTEPIRTDLIEAGVNVEIHDDHFARDEEDRIWLQAAGERGWVVLEIAAFRESNARVFALTAGNSRGVEIAAAFVNALPEIFNLLRVQPGPVLARVSRLGRSSRT
jgi:hypothetical protein